MPNPSSGQDTRSRLWLAVLATVAVLFLGAVTARAGNGSVPAPKPILDLSKLLTRPTAPTTVPVAPVAAPPQLPGSSLLAAPKGTIATYASPGGAPSSRLADQWYGYPMVVPVLTQQGGWLHVRLPQRPNQSTAWLRVEDVTLSTTAYRMELDLSSRRLTAYHGNQVIADMPAGVGTSSTPTPTGNFFIASQADPLGPGYGAFMLVTSAHSEAIASWQGLGDAIIAIHGPISSSSDAQIGTTGTNISNGCIRLHNSDLNQLGVIPPGTPLDIFY